MPMSGKDMLKLFYKNGWEFVRQTGSHVQIKKGGLNETVPLHRELKKGTEHGLLKSLKKGGK